MPDRPSVDKHSPPTIHPELSPIFLRIHSRVLGEKPRQSGEGNLPDKWANFALVFDCETTTDIRQDLNFLWCRFCELKEDRYVCQQEGLVYADNLDAKSIDLMRRFAHNNTAETDDGCPKDILVQSRTEFVDGEFWQAIQAGAVIVCFNAPFDLSRLALEYREAQSKNTGWSMVLWTRKGGADVFRPKIRIKPKDSRSAFISLAGGDPNNRAIYRGRFLDLSVLGWALRNRHMDLNGFLRSFGLKPKMDHEPTGQVTKERAEVRSNRREANGRTAERNEDRIRRFSTEPPT